MTAQPKPNFTAWFVMQGMIAAMRHPDFLDAGNETTLALYQPLSNAASKTRHISRIIHSLPYGWQYKIGDMVTNRGRMRHFYFRKKEIEKQVRALLGGETIKQVIVLGAGLDVLSLRLAPEYGSVKFIEIDTEESQNFKIASLRAGNVDLPGNVEFIEGDLRNPLSGILANSQFYDASAKTLWIAEGFFMFIPEESVVRICEEVKQLSATGSSLIFTTMSSKKTTPAIAHVMQRLYLHKEKSPFVWAIPPDKVSLFIKNLGYEVTYCMDGVALQKNYMGHKFNKKHCFVEAIHIAKT